MKTHTQNRSRHLIHFIMHFAFSASLLWTATCILYADSPIFPSVETSNEYRKTVQSYDLEPIIETGSVKNGHANSQMPVSETAKGLADKEVRFKDFPDSPVTKSSFENKLIQQSGTTLSPAGADGHSSFVRGNGIDSSEVQTTFQDLSLNSVAGSGYDLASFPVWFWNSASVSPGFDRLQFSLQTDADVKTDVARDEIDSSKSGIFASASTESTYTAGVSHSRPGHYSIQTGMLMGRSIGPALSFSNRFQLNAKTEFYQHVLLMNKETTFYKTLKSGPNEDSTSTQVEVGNQKEIRAIPVLEVNRKILDGTLGITGAYDWSHLKFNGAYDTRDFGDRSTLVGTFKHPDWDFESRLEQIHYRTLSMNAVSEANTKSELKHLFELGDPSLTLTPGIGLKGQLSGGPVRTSTLPFDPIASFGFKKVWGLDGGSLPNANRKSIEDRIGNLNHSKSSTFSSDLQIRYDHSDSSLVNRFYNLPGFFEGNPNLEPDHWVKAESTHELKVRDQRFGLSVFGQRRWNVQQNTIDASGIMTVENVGKALSYGISPYVMIRPIKWLDGSMRLNLKQSRLDSQGGSSVLSNGNSADDTSGESFTFEPSKELFASVMATIETDIVKLHFGPDFHAVSSYISTHRSVFAPNGSTQPGFGLVSFQMASEWSGGFDVQASLQNIFDKQIEWIPGTTSYDREVSIAVSARL